MSRSDSQPSSHRKHALKSSEMEFNDISVRKREYQMKMKRINLRTLPDQNEDKPNARLLSAGQIEKIEINICYSFEMIPFSLRRAENKIRT